ncbi:hypothetical protein XA68_16607 [Ophiocordyceps unilateralis]|uniref:Carrier domain-containing protein n=1 Tax=Ophiocordyceps unilateralis TaxID=268505 RepID=A0A2A9P5Z6_OPHUN|nr:hypothetical protein XA68_16607 [Ophiocordyceps unilateralis]
MAASTNNLYATENMAELLVFGDLTANFGDDLRCLLHVKDSEALQPFFDRVAFSLREEIGRQPTAVQDLFPRFTTLIDLVAKADETEGAPLLRFCLMTVCQLAKFIHFAEGRPYPTAQDTYLLGVCTGTFAASAISVSRTISDVVASGVEATRAAFRTALCSFIHRGIITTAGNKSWSAVVSREKPLGRLIEDFPAGNALSRPYISATSPTNATISGPPEALQSFIAGNGLQAHRLAIQSPFHAPHIFGEADVDFILQRFPEAEFEGKPPVIPLFSGATGRKVVASGLGDLLREAASSVLLQVVRWEDILAAISSTLSERKLSKLVLSPFYCNATSLLSSYVANETGIEVAVQNIVTAPPKAKKPTGRFDQSKIAIVGYSGRFPDAADTDELWELLHAGRDVHRDIPASRFDWETYHDGTGKKRNTNKVRHGCFIKEPGLFDTRFFNMSPREADSTDPAHRLAITATYEAMEMAGMVPNRTPSTQQDRVGVFMGICSDDWREVNASQNVDTYHIPGGVRAFLPGRISYFFRFSGPSLSIDTACSSSFAAIQSAVGYLLRGECDTAVAGGTNILTNPDIFTGLDRGHFLAQTGNCNTFDDAASGYCRAEAVGAVILKRLEDAVADRDPIFGVIVGANTNHCGQTDSITRPHEGDQVSVFNRVLRYQNIDPNDVGYVEMHGTGTQAGDATEMRSVMSVFLPDKKRTEQQPLYLGSAKANVGHSESASGVVSMIKVLLMMKNDEIPPHCGIKGVINRNYPKDLAERNIRIAFEPTAWPKLADGKTRKVFLNNFSAAGGNTAILIEDAPPRDDDDEVLCADQRASHLVSVTAKTAKALEANIRRIVAFLDANPDTSLAALAYTTTARRMHHNFRVACSGDSIPAIKKELELRAAVGAAGFKSIPGPAKLPDVVFVFTGQGSLYTSLGRELFETLPGFRDDMMHFNRLATQQGFPEFLSLVDGSATSLEGVDTCTSHLALVCLQMALTRAWKSWKIRPAMVVGHSLGEYAALYAAGVISASDAIFLVGTRASLLARCCTPGTHAMLAVKAAVDVVRPLLASSSCEVTCINQPAGTVVGGKKEHIESFTAKLRQQGIDSTLLEIPFSFHTAQVEPILEAFEKAARGVEYGAAQVPIFSPLLGRVVVKDEPEPIFNGEYLAKACRGVVNFQGVLEEARASSLVNDSTVWLELGSHPACSGMIKSTLGAASTALPCLRKSVSPWKTMVSALETMYLRGLVVDWNNFHRGFHASHQVVQLPRYSWDLKNHWIQYKNDWLLYKGEGIHAPVSQQQQQQQQQQPQAAKIPDARYVSPSVQRVLEEKHGAQQSTLLAESDIYDQRLIHVLQGHVVNGAALCPSTLYGDIALTVTKALIDGNASAGFTGFDVADVKIDRPLVALPSKTSQLFRVSATADWSAQVVAVSIYSVEKGIKTADHAAINVYLTADKTSFLDEWRRVAYLIKGRIAALEQGVANGNAHKLKRSMAYKLFGSIVKYSPEYQGMQEVILDSDELEATAKVTLQVGDQGFFMNPHWIDSMGHLAGFIMNGNEHLPSETQVFINHGWSHLRFGEMPQVGKVYTTYNKMQVVEGKLYAGDTYILDGDRIVAVFDQVAFQGVPRRLLDMTLGKAGGKEASTTTTAAAATTPAALKAAAAPSKPSSSSAPKPSSSSSAPKPSSAPPKTTAAAAAAAPKAAAPSNKSKDFNRVLAIIAEEIGVGLSELQPESEFADFGLDSLLSLTVTARINEEVGIDIPWTLFAAYPTVKDMKSLLDPEVAAVQEEEEEEGEGETPQVSSSCSSSSTDDSETVASDGENFKAIIRQTIADETGTPVEELSATTCLADLGVDSLLGLTIADTLSGALGAEVSSPLLMELATLDDIEATLGKMLGLNMDLTPAASTPVMVVVQPVVEDIVVVDDDDDDVVVSSPPHATSIALHSAKTKAPGRTLFMLPDGSGSAASYATLAKIDASLTVYGVNCPWRTTPEDMADVTFKQLISKFVAEIQRRQPHGPYLLGGWSAGGIFAFEAARELMAANEDVERLVLLDSPNPIGLENPPDRMYEFFGQSGVLGGMTGGKAVPEWLRRHFAATVSLLDTYEPKPLANAPETLHVYARDGICKDPSGPKMETRPDDPREMLWLLNNRTDFSADGWASLLGRDKLTVKVVDDVNHFSMMNEGAHMEAMRNHVRKLLSL